MPIIGGNFDSDGAFTGHVTADMLINSGIKWTLIGSSERKGFRTTESVIARKALVAIEKGMNVIVCVGIKNIWRSRERFNIDKKTYTK